MSRIEDLRNLSTEFKDEANDESKNFAWSMVKTFGWIVVVSVGLGRLVNHTINVGYHFGRNEIYDELADTYGSCADCLEKHQDK